jgi:two-component system chemotaxis sensor kinase CheA
MEIDLSRFRAAFFEEAGEHLENMEAGLLALETSGGDREVLNTIFRAAHSIKGASSTFGMDQVARFTHVLENLLDRMRDGEVLPTMELCELLLKSTDVLTALIQAEKNQTAVPEQMEATFSALQQYSANPSEVVSAPAIATAPVSAPAGRTFQIEFKPSHAFFHFGQNPLFLIDELQKLGTDFSIQADDSRIPSLSQIDPEASYLSWTITLTTTSTESALLDVFMFVDAESIPVIREVQTQVVATHPAADQTNAAKQIAGSPKPFVEGKDFGLFEQTAPPDSEAPGKNGANVPGKISAAIPDRRVDAVR